MRTQVRSLASLSRLRICYCRELWYRSQHGSDPAVLCYGCGVGQQLLNPSLGISRCCGWGPKKPKKKIEQRCSADFLVMNLTIRCDSNTFLTTFFPNIEVTTLKNWSAQASKRKLASTSCLHLGWHRSTSGKGDCQAWQDHAPGGLGSAFQENSFRV